MSPVTACPSCGANLEGNTRFCDTCGAALPRPGPAAPVPGSLTCPTCGAAYVAGELFCDVCGVQLPPVAVVPPGPPTPIALPPSAGAQKASTPSARSGLAAPTQPARTRAKPAGVNGSLVIESAQAVITWPPGKDEILIGRLDPPSGVFPDVDLTPYGAEAAGVSRRHARLLLEGHQVMIEDLGSTNFTFVRHERVTPGRRVPVHSGDNLHFGRMAATYQAPAA